MRLWALLLMFLGVLASGADACATAAKPVAVGVLKFGTVNWQLDTIKTHRLDMAAGFSLDVSLLASKNATSVALLAGEVDLIVSDWIWVMRQRAAGDDLLFVPFSHSLGALVTPAAGDIATVADLVGKSIGVAGGPVDKSWLILRAWSERTLGIDIGERATPVFAAPPLLSEQLRRGDVDAALTFWPYAARLEADGYRRLAAVSELLADLGIEGQIPLVGYVFRERLARERPDDLLAFFQAVAAANEILLQSDGEWKRLRPLMRVDSDSEFDRLKAGFRTGVPEDLAVNPTQAEALHRLLAERGGAKLLGHGTRFDPEAFWTPGAP